MPITLPVLSRWRFELTGKVQSSLSPLSHRHKPVPARLSGAPYAVTGLLLPSRLAWLPSWHAVLNARSLLGVVAHNPPADAVSPNGIWEPRHSHRAGAFVQQHPPFMQNPRHQLRVQ